MQFVKASKTQSRLRMALMGPSGSGKTYTALAIASKLGLRVAVIDTEHGSASKYADKYEFDVLDLQSFSPLQYIEAMQAAQSAGYDVIVVDSLSHAWMGKDGALEQVDRAAKRSGGGNSFAGWRDVTPLQNKLIEAMVACRAHLIATMRVKTEYVMEANEKGKQAPRKVGLAPVQRDGLEYEFDVVGDMTIDNELSISKTRCPALAGGFFKHPGAEVAGILKTWLTDGTPMPPPVTSTQSQQGTLSPEAAKIHSSIVQLLAKLPSWDQSRGGELLVKAGDNVDRLQDLLDRVKFKLNPSSPEPTRTHGDAHEGAR